MAYSYSTTKTLSPARLVQLFRRHPILEKHRALWPRELQQPETFLIEGLYGSAPACVMAALVHLHPFLVIATDKEEAGYLYSDLARVATEHVVDFFPSAYRKHIRYGQKDSAGEIMRTEVLADLSAQRNPIIVTYPDALAEPVPSTETLSSHLWNIKQGDNIDRKQLKEKLQEWGFVVVDYVYDPGQIAFRGSIVDVYSYHGAYPVRLDFLDNEVESIRYFDVQTQLSVTVLQEVTLAPSLANGESDTAHSCSLLELLPPSYVLWSKNIDYVEGQWAHLSQTAPDAESTWADLQSLQHHLVSVSTQQDLLEQRTIYLQQPSHNRISVTASYAFKISPQPLYHKDFDRFIAGMSGYKKEGRTLFLMTEVEQQARRLAEILQERNRPDLIPSLIPITLHEGFEDPDLKGVFLTDHQLFDRFHRYSLKSERMRNNEMAITLQELQNFYPGDYIVHSDHGVGQFDGLMTLQAGGPPQEVVKLLYRDGDIVFVGLHSLHKLSKYRGKDDQPPQLSKVGTGAWQRMKDRTKKKIKDIARDLIALYAARKEKEGFAFSPDSYLQHQMEASFIYEETPDQLAAVQAVKEDMESSKPMDRLICGDVGFGKTEVAIRAAFKAVADNKQVAVLVPTTILAYQHYTTFQERLQEMPVRVEYLSRSKKNKQSKEIIEGVKTGKIDIIIGTHRLLSKDFHFHNLGLLIIDEEQKFGVAAKEKLRTLQVNVDTLALSATPIPRTLQFSLMGARDLSNINTPPPNRLPINTEVMRFSRERIQEAIELELARQGQVYIVHNRVKNIEDLHHTIQSWVPKARIAVAHGQLPPQKLEELLPAFAAHEYDILIATSIIENGIDVSNANTMIINNAHYFGLSDLHQLRGRVGRSNRKAFCYLITPPLDTLPENAARRIKAIAAYSELGSGIRIAIQDLDIRGAGNILGAEQSGFIAELGPETYRKVFEEAVREVKTEEFAQLFEDQKEELSTTDCTVETDLILSFPDEYVPSDAERIALYRKIDNLQSNSERERFEQDLQDRFGAPVPTQVQQLLRVPELRRIGSKLGVEKLVIRDQNISLYLPLDPKSHYYSSPSFDKLIAYAASHHSSCSFRENHRGRRSVRIRQIASITEAINKLQEIVQTSPRHTS